MTGCYIIYSPLFNKFYIGSTQQDPHLRLQKHNDKTYGSKYTSFTADWEIFLFIECANYSQAVNMERHIKSMKSTKYLYNLKAHPEMIERLREKYV